MDIQPNQTCFDGCTIIYTTNYYRVAIIKTKESYVSGVKPIQFHVDQYIYMHTSHQHLKSILYVDMG